MQVDVWEVFYNDFMKPVCHANDARQTSEWGIYLRHLGWKTEKVERPGEEPLYAFIKIIPFIGTMVKIQHPKGPIPFNKIDEIASKYKASVVIIEPDIVGYVENDYQLHGYEISKMRYVHSATIRIELDAKEEELLKSFSENARRNIKKAEKNLRTKIIELNKNGDESVLETFFSLYVKLGKMKKFYVPSRDEIFAKLKAFKKNSFILFAYEKSSADPHAALWVGLCNKTMVYFQPGNTKRGYDLQANYLLIWEAMKLAIQQNAAFFDLESAYDSRYPHENKKWKGYTEFKRKFGGEMIYFPPSWIKIYNPVFKIFYRIGTILPG